MPKRTVILIILLTTLTAILVALAVRNERQSLVEGPQEQSQIVEQELEKTAELTFSPQEVVLASTAATATVDIMIDTKEYSVDGVQLELVYDPAVLSNVEIVSPQQNFFGGPGDSNNLFNEVDVSRGRVSYWLGINPVLTNKRGAGTVAQLSFTLNPQSTATETQIEILDRSMITENTSHTSVLATPSPLNITIAR